MAYIDPDFISEISNSAVINIKHIIGEKKSRLEIIDQLLINGIDVTARTCHTKFGKHEFLIAKYMDDDIYIDNTMSLLFDTAYLSFVEMPEVFIGNEEHLLQLIFYVCGNISKYYHCHEIALPPWRQLSHIKNFWFSKLHNQIFYNHYGYRDT